MTEPETPEAAQPPRQCPWCAAAVTEEATHCPACGAAVAQRDSIGGLKIPGLTSVDPALEDFDKRPLHLRGPSPTQGMAPALIVGAMAGGPIGLVAIGGMAAVAGAELMATRRGGPGSPDLADVGKPSEVLLQALERADEAGDDDANEEAPIAEPAAEGPDHAAEDGGRSIWRDLPPSAEPEPPLDEGA
jgi:hypothetical protein